MHALSHIVCLLLDLNGNGLSAALFIGWMLAKRCALYRPPVGKLGVLGLQFGLFFLAVSRAAGCTGRSTSISTCVSMHNALHMLLLRVRAFPDSHELKRSIGH